MTPRKPHAVNAGYVAERKCWLGGHVVIYRTAEAGFDADEKARWTVMHEPSSLHVCVETRAVAYDIMRGVAAARTLDEAREYADILPDGENLADDEETGLRRQG